MNQTILTQIESRIMELTADDQLRLISRVADRLRRQVEDDSDFEARLAEMAEDEYIRAELSNIEQDFAVTEFDGLLK